MSEHESKRIIRVEGRAVPVRGNDIDTDRIIPARFMKVVTFDGLGEYAFNDVRYDEEGNKKDHPFNDPVYAGARVLIAQRNFGCGSSREHAPQALMRYGINAVVAESYAEIFAGNCTAMGVPVISLSHDEIEELMARVEAEPTTVLVIDLESQVLTAGSLKYHFTLPQAYRNALIGGSWDSTSVLLAQREEIRSTAARLPYMEKFL